MGRYSCVLVDIDGVIKNRGTLIPGSITSLKTLLQQGFQVKLVTNCSLHKIYNLGNQLIPGYQLDILDPIDVVKDLLKRDPWFQGKEIYVMGSKVIRTKIATFDVSIREKGSWQGIDAVFLFEKRTYEESDIEGASKALIAGARFYCAGLDRHFWHEEKLHPGVGAITEQLIKKTGSNPIVLGKPSKDIFVLALHDVKDLKKVIFIGDDFHIDIIGAKAVGISAALIGDDNHNSSSVTPDFVAADFESLLLRQLFD